jgi:ubiquinone biosynthesis O-methyltransferase
MSDRLHDREDLWGYRKRLRFVRDVINESFPARSAETIRILDVGCGNGSQLSLPLAQLGFQLTGIDTDERSIAKARSLAGGIKSAQFVCGRLDELPPQDQFDVVLLSEVLEHLSEPEELLSMSVSRMRGDSVLIVTVPNGYGEFEMDSWLFRGFRLQRLVDVLVKNNHDVVASTENSECEHVQFFTRTRLRELFASYDLTITREAAGSFLAGPMIGHTLARSNKFIDWNARITDKLPLALASSWYFALKRTNSNVVTQAGAGS